MAHLPDRTVRRLSNGTRYHVGRVDGECLDWAVAVAEIGEGNLTAAAETTRAIEHFEPDVILFVGVAGSLKPDVAHGAVVVANKVYRYHSGKDAEDFLSRPMTFATWHGLEQLVRQVRQTSWTDTSPRPLVELKPIAAGEVVVASTNSGTFRMLRERCNDAVAVDMESAGLYEAAHRANGLATLAVRGISDMVDDKTPGADTDWQPVAARHAAAFAFALLKAAHPGDLGLTPPPSPYSTERSELLATVPPPAAAAFERALKEPGPALRILREMADTEKTPAEIAEDLARQTAAGLSSDLSIAVAEYASAHSLHVAASGAFESAARCAPGGASRLLARAALASAAVPDPTRASELLAEAMADSKSDQEAHFADVVAAAVAEDASAIDRAARKHGLCDGDTSPVTTGRGSSWNSIRLMVPFG